MPPRKRSNRKLSELYIWFKRHWAIRTIIGFLPSVWIPIVLSQSGKAIGIVLPDGKWTILAWLPTIITVSYTHLRAHETRHDLVCRLLLEKKKNIRIRINP